jgi:hypothetical protein
MKKLVFFLFLFILSTVVVHAQAADIWYKGSTITIAWDAVTGYEDGTPIVAGETVTYNIFVKNDKTGTETRIGTSSSTTSPVAVPAKGWWRFGVQAVNGTDLSNIAYSSNAVSCLNGQTFGLRYLNPADPKSLRKP